MEEQIHILQQAGLSVELAVKCMVLDRMHCKSRPKLNDTHRKGVKTNRKEIQAVLVVNTGTRVLKK